MKYTYLPKVQTEGNERLYDRFSVDGVECLVNIELANRVHLGHRLRSSYRIVSKKRDLIKVVGVSKKLNSDLTSIIYGYLM